MKKILFVVIFSAIAIAGFGQKWQGFFSPATDHPYFTREVTADRNLAGIWLFRPTVSLSAMRFNIQKEITVESFTSLGTGITFNHYRADGYNDFGLSGIILFGTNPGGVSPASLSLAVTGNFLQYIQVGAGYDINKKIPFVLTGVTITFN